MPEATARLLEQRFSPERLGPYQAAVGGDLDQAVALYEWNAKMSGVFWITLGHVEVLIRNAMHRQLTDWSTQAHGEPRWYLDPGQVLAPRRREEIAEARRRATRDGRQETPGRVVAELTFGFWRYLLISSYDRSLWPHLRNAWPSKQLRREVHNPVADLHEFRNRIAHHEPIYNRPLRELHTKALDLASWTCPDTAAWISSRCDVLAVLATRPWTARTPSAPPQRRNARYNPARPAPRR
ncbi:Abi family protein [Micromonospora maris]|uniref:Abi family protein n=1 Tax=Micromonospora maris TaxID=1003110 RepID=UPI000303FFAA|nr:Abi family protein [Micromonospora maris]